MPKITLTDVAGGTEVVFEREEDAEKEALPELVTGLGAPHMLIEQDILHVACQLTDRDAADLPLPLDNLTKTVLEAARAFKQGVVDREQVIELIGKKFWRMPCVPIEFTNTFVYHPMNSFFGEMIVNDPATNAALRANLMNERAMRQCDEAKSEAFPLDFTLCANDQTWFNIFKEEDADEVAVNLENSIKQDANNDLDLSLGNVSIEDCEPLNASDDFVAIPSAINFCYPSAVITDEEQMSLLNNNGVPDQQAAVDSLQAEIDALDGRIDFQLGEGEKHIGNSAIYGQGIK